MTPEQLEKLQDAVEEQTADINTYITRKIVRQIVETFKKAGELALLPASLFRMQMLAAATALQEDLAAGMNQYEMKLQEIAADTFKQAALEIAHEQDELTRLIAESVGVVVPQIMQEGTIDERVRAALTQKEIRMINSAYQRTAGTMDNLCHTTADAAQETFINACDRGYYRATHGTSPMEAIIDAIDETAQEGATTVWYGPRVHHPIEVAVARCVRTGINQTNGDINLTRAAELGTSYVLTSQHMGARTGDGGPDYTNHSWWQGKVYHVRYEGEFAKYAPTRAEQQENSTDKLYIGQIAQAMTDRGGDYPDFEETCGYGDVQGICGANCRHSFSVFVPGVMTNTYKPIDPEENKRVYDLTQKQRAKERALRKTKRRVEAMKDAPDGPEKDKKLEHLKELQKKQGRELLQFARENSLSMSNWRTQV